MNEYMTGDNRVVTRLVSRGNAVFALREGAVTR